MKRKKRIVLAEGFPWIEPRMANGTYFNDAMLSIWKDGKPTTIKALSGTGIKRIRLIAEVI